MTAVVVRQRNQITIPKAIAEEAGITEGTVIDLVYANGVITVSLPERHGRATLDLSTIQGVATGVWGRDQEEIDRNVRALRDEWERGTPEW